MSGVRYNVELLVDYVWSDRHLVFENRGLVFYLRNSTSKDPTFDVLPLANLLRIHKAMSEDGKRFVLCITQHDNSHHFIKFNEAEPYEECASSLLCELQGKEVSTIRDALQTDLIEIPQFLSRNQTLWTQEQLDNLEELILRAVSRDDDVTLSKLALAPMCITRSSSRHLYSPVFTASKFNRVKSVRLFGRVLGSSIVVLRDDVLGWTCLHHAAANGCAETVVALLEMGADPLEETKFSMNAILLSIMHGKGNCLRILLKTCPQFIDSLSKPHLAALSKSSALLKRLDISSLDQFPEMCKNGFPTPLHFACALARDDESITVLVSKQSLNAKDYCGYPPLFYAAMANRANAIRALGLVGANFLQTDFHGRTALHIAAMYGSARTIAALVEHSVGLLNSRDSSGCTPLHYAILHGRNTAISTLIAMDADLLACPKGSNLTPLMCAFATKNSAVVKDKVKTAILPPTVLTHCLHAAAASGDSEGVNLLTSAGADYKARDSKCRTVFHFAKNGDIVRELSRLPGASALIESFTSGNTPLHTAALSGCAATLKALISCGARVTALDEEGRTALEVALKYEQEACSIILIEYESNLQRRYTDGDTVLLKAAKLDFCRLLTSLIRKNCDLNIVDSQGRAALHLAAILGHQDFVKQLVSAGADTYVLDDYEMLPLFYGVLSGVLGCVSSLYPTRGSLPCLDYIGNGNTMLHLLAQFIVKCGTSQGPMCNYTSVISFLLRKGYSATAMNDSGETPVHILCGGTHTEALKAILEGTDPNTVDIEGRAPLHVCAESGTDSTTSVLIELGAKFDRADACGRTPIFYASASGNTESLQVLIDSHANVKVKSESGHTALHVAAMNGNEKIIPLLVKAGADVNAKTEEGVTPFHSGCASNDGLRTVRALINAGANVKAKTKDGLTGESIAKEKKHSDIYEFLTNPNFAFPPSPSDSPTLECEDSTCNFLSNTQNKTKSTQDLNDPNSGLKWAKTRPTGMKAPEHQTQQKRTWTTVKPSGK